MKKNTGLASKLFTPAIFVLALGLSPQTFAQNETPLPSTVVRLSGHARSSTDGGKKWKQLKLGDIVNSGTMVQTAKTSDLDLLLGEQVKPSAKDAFYNPDVRPGNLVSLSADTLLKLDKLVKKQTAGSTEAAEEIMLELQRGTVTGNVKKLGADSKYEIGFPGGVAGTREAIYTLHASGQMSVLKGKAFVALTDGQTVKEVTVGNEFNPGTRSIDPLPLPVQPRQEISPATPPQSKNSVTPAAPTRETTPPPQRPLPRSGVRRAAP